VSDAAAQSLQALAAGQTLSASDTYRMVASILDGGVDDSVTASILTVLHVRGETVDELTGAARAIRERMVTFDAGAKRDRLIDTCGTGGDGANTVNISTASAIVVAACGVPVVKHGNRAASGKSGSSEVLTALGIATDPDPSLLRLCLQELDIAFLLAPAFHPGLKGVVPVRRKLPFRTLFNLVGPLCNPASPPYQLLGVPNDAHASLIANVLTNFGHIRRAVIVTGSDGLDEVTLSGPTTVRIVEPGEILTVTQWTPQHFGLSTTPASALRVEGPADSADRIRKTFEGQPGPVRDYIVANSAAALWTAGKSSSVAECSSQAAHAIDSGEALELLDRWAKLAPTPAS
jgi:anthranilate phosphoribosyltransferase